MVKTLSFAVVHFTIAFSLAFILTGDIILGSLIAMLEPMVNTGAFYLHEKVWATNKLAAIEKRAAHYKVASFAVTHFAVAFTVVYLLTGNLLAGGLLALLEPSVNTFAYYLHEKAWQRYVVSGHHTQAV
jgi:uncharacterized membrane protein